MPTDNKINIPFIIFSLAVIILLGVGIYFGVDYFINNNKIKPDPTPSPPDPTPSPPDPTPSPPDPTPVSYTHLTLPTILRV